MKRYQYNNAGLARTRILAVFIATIVAVGAMLLLGAYPLNKRVLLLNDEIDEVDAALVPYLRLLSQEPLSTRVERELRMKTDMAGEWETLLGRLQTFRADARLADLLASSEEGRIDYKVALFDARQRMSQMASERNIQIPSDLGMTETIGADEVMASRLWQLAANASLTEILIKSDVIAIEALKLLEPMQFPLTSLGESNIMNVYPVQVTVVTSLESLLKLMAAIDGEDGFFALQRLMIDSIDPIQTEVLRVKAIASALLFRDDYMFIEDPTQDWDEIHWDGIMYHHDWEGWQ